MMNFEKIRELSELLARGFLGALDEEKQKAYQEWRKNSQNKQIEKDILNFDAFEDWRKKIEKVETSQQWDSFLERMDNRHIDKKVVRLSVMKRIATIAAAFLIVFVAYQLYQSSNFGKNYQTISEAVIKPGTPHAQLVLSNGDVVDLDEESNDKLTEGSMSLVNSDGELAYSESSESVEPIVNTLKIPRGAEYKLELPDGTKVWLNSESELSYTLPFVGDRRIVNLKGEAYFDVAPNKVNPFIVSVEKQDVEVLGTEFNISAYKGDESIVTTLVEGKVKVSHQENGQVKAQEFLLPNEQSIYTKATGKIHTQKVDVYPYVAWKDGQFVFKSETLESFLSKAARWYDVEVIFTDEHIKDLKFTGDLPRDIDMSGILEVLKAETSVNVKVEGNKRIYVSE
ncbi:FecR domain-containing protein [Limibacter armeniacum]|uniref:FecR family protein n=1 Tax=Limibacter armeniacum TaxID=466084 RepID=UPI002FE68F3D